MAPPASDSTDLTEEQRLHCRQLITQYAELDAHERAAWVDNVVRDVWLMQNEEYNWTLLGAPDPNNVDLTFGWTEKVRAPFTLTMPPLSS